MPRKVSRNTRDYVQELNDYNAGNHDASAEMQSERDNKVMQLQGLQQRAESRRRCCCERGDLRGILLHHGFIRRLVQRSEMIKKGCETGQALEFR